ncbi:MAG: oxidoreductase [Chromatiales bacterium]|nr:oxidoreductase [Gammaproteobacteria bacterium]
MNNPTPDSAWSNTCPAVVIDSRRISPDDTDEVTAIRLGIADPAFRFQEGQTIGVLVPGPHAFGTKPHHRYYSIANARDRQTDDEIEIQIIVRRCFYIDEVSGEQFPGIASNYLCDAKAGDQITLTGPYKSVFNIPKKRDSNLLMIGTGTGIAPFRAFIQRIYSNHHGWDGKVRLFFGDKSGLDLLYMNDVDNDLANYYMEETFEAYQSISNKYVIDADKALELTLNEYAAEAWSMLQDPKTYVFLAGTRKANDMLDNILSQHAGSTEAWDTLKQKIEDENRWSELLYL